MTKAELIENLKDVADDAVIVIGSRNVDRPQGYWHNDVSEILKCKAAPNWLVKDEVILIPTKGRV